MTDILSLLTTRHRPRLMMQAARLGTRDYRRDRHLGRLLGMTNLPGSCEAALRLMALEDACEAARVSGDGAYSVTRHLEVLIALICESRTILTDRLGQETAPKTPALRLAI
ncbi:MAG: DUF6477 family protein [Qingshengfaniella sp.]